MGILILKQTTKTGATKQWKIDSKSERLTFGTSRKANIVSIDPKHEAIQVVLQYRDQRWHFIRFSTQENSPDLLITDSTQVKVGDSSFTFKVIEFEQFITSSLQSGDYKGTEQKKLLLVTRNQRLLKTEVKDLKETFYYPIHGVMEALPFKGSTTWEETTIDGINFKSKIINVDDMKKIGVMPRDQMMDKEGKRMAIMALASIVCLMLVGLFASKPTEAPVAQKLNLPASMTVKIEPKKEKKKNKTNVAKSSARSMQREAPATSASAASPTKVKALLKGAIGMRISQLIGKVSATDARTANVISTAQGVKAGEGSSGRALAAVGNVEASGRNWTGEAVGTGAGKVGTAGIAGGNGTGGLSNSLAAGKTGSGGVGLIEEESEVEGGLDREIIAQYIKSQLGQILYCYERQLSADASLAGKVAVKFTISGTGQVVAQNIGASDLNSKPVEGCILNKVSKWKFPEPKGGTKVVVTYPFLFKSTN